MGGATAVTLQTHNGNFVMNNFTINEINEITPVIAVDEEVAGGFTDRTGFGLCTKKLHVLPEK